MRYSLKTCMAAVAIALSPCLLFQPTTSMANARTQCHAGQISRMDQKTQNKMVHQSLRSIGPPRNISKTSCLKGFIGNNTFINLPSLSSLIQRAINHVCQALSKSWNSITPHLNRTLSLPYGLGSVGTSPKYGTVNPSSNPVNKIAGRASSAANKIGTKQRKLSHHLQSKLNSSSSSSNSFNIY